MTARIRRLAVPMPVQDVDFEARQRLYDTQALDAVSKLVKSFTETPTLRKKFPTQAAQIDGLVVKKLPGGNAHVPYIPLSLRQELLGFAHGANGIGHYSARYLQETLSNVCWWPTMQMDAEDFVKNCVGCALAGSQPRAQPPSLGMPVPEMPFDLVGLDLLKLPKSPRGNQYLCVFTDYLTRWVEAVPLTDKSADSVARAFLEVIFTRHGLPRTILTDQGTEFQERFKSMCQMLGIQRITSAVSSANKRINRTVQPSFYCVAGRLRRQQS